jgi:hypothetical protein
VARPSSPLDPTPIRRPFSTTRGITSEQGITPASAHVRPAVRVTPGRRREALVRCVGRASRRPTCRHPAQPGTSRSARAGSTGATAVLHRALPDLASRGGDRRRRRDRRSRRLRGRDAAGLRVFDGLAAVPLVEPGRRRFPTAGLRATRHGQHPRRAGHGRQVHVLPAGIGAALHRGRHRADRRPPIRAE